MVSGRQVSAAVALVVAAVGLIALMLPMSATEDGPFGAPITIECGSPIAHLDGGPSMACDDVYGDRRAWAVPLLAVGVIAFIGTAIVASPARRPKDATRPDIA